MGWIEENFSWNKETNWIEKIIAIYAYVVTCLVIVLQHYLPVSTWFIFFYVLWIVVVGYVFLPIHIQDIKLLQKIHKFLDFGGLPVLGTIIAVIHWELTIQILRIWKNMFIRWFS